MSEPDLRRLLRDAADHDAVVDAASLQARLDVRLDRRRRRRQAVRGAGALVVVLVLVVAVRGLTADRVVRVDLAAPTAQLMAVDPAADAVDGAPDVPAAQVAHLPTRLPDGYRRCAGPARAGELARTTFCAAGAPDLILDAGPHWALPEEGRRYAVGRRIGHLERRDGGWAMTVSDGNTDADTHLRLTVAGPGPADPALLAAVLASIPAVVEAPPPR